MNPYKHAEISVNKWGGVIDDYYAIHKLMDGTKEVCSDNRHRIFHTHWGINRVIIPLVGDTITNTDGKIVVIKDLCEFDHILPDYKNRFIPTLSDFVECLDADLIPDWKNKIEKIHQRYKGNKELEALLLSPLINTGQMKALLLTHNGWFINGVVKKLFDIEIELRDFEISVHEVFNTMKFELWMDNGAAYPQSAEKIIETKII